MDVPGPSVVTRAKRVVDLLLMAACWSWSWIAFVKLLIEEPREVGWEYQAAVYVLGTAATSAWGWATYYTRSPFLAVISGLEAETFYFTWKGFSEYTATGSEHHIDGLRLRTSLLKGLPMAIMGLVISGWGLSSSAVCQMILPQAQGRLHRECGDRHRQLEPADLSRAEHMTKKRMIMLEQLSKGDWNIDYNITFGTRTSIRVITEFEASEECRRFVRKATAAWNAAGCSVEQVSVEEVSEDVFNKMGGFFPPSSPTIWKPRGVKHKFLDRIMPLYAHSVDKAFATNSWSLMTGYDKVSFVNVATGILKSRPAFGPRIKLNYKTTPKTSGAFALLQATNAFISLAKHGLSGRDAAVGTTALMYAHVAAEGLFMSTALVNVFVAVPAARGFQEAVHASVDKVQALAADSAAGLSTHVRKFKALLTSASFDGLNDITRQEETESAERNRKSLLSLGEWMMEHMTPLMLPSMASFLCAARVLAVVFVSVSVATIVLLRSSGLPCAMQMLMVLIGFMGSPCVRLSSAPLCRNAMRWQLVAKTVGTCVLWISPMLCGYEEGFDWSFGFLFDRDFNKSLFVVALTSWTSVSLATGMLVAHKLPEVKRRGGQAAAEASGATPTEQAASQLPGRHWASYGSSASSSSPPLPLYFRAAPHAAVELGPGSAGASQLRPLGPQAGYGATAR